MRIFDNTIIVIKQNGVTLCRREESKNIPNRMFIAFDLVGNHCVTWWRDWRSGEADGNHTEREIFNGSKTRDWTWEKTSH